MEKKMTCYRTVSIGLVEDDVYVCETCDGDTGEYGLRYDSFAEDSGPAQKDVFLFVWFEYYGSRKERAFFIRDVFLHRIELTDEETGVVGSLGRDHEVEAASQMLSLAHETIARQLEAAGLSIHRDTFEKLSREKLSPENLKASYARWRKEEEEEKMLADAEMVYSRFPIKIRILPS